MFQVIRQLIDFEEILNFNTFVINIKIRSGMFKIIKNVRWRPIHKNIYAKFSTDNNKDYIPLRSLKEERTVLFDSSYRNKVSWFARLLVYTPFLALSLEGLINEWSPLVIGGAVFFFMYGFRKMGRVRFYASHEVYTMVVAKNLSRFEFTLCYNQFTRLYQEIVEASLGQTHQTYLLNQFKRGIYETREQDEKTQQKQLSDEEVVKKIENIQDKQNRMIIELTAHQIDRMEFVNEKQVKRLISQRMWNYYRKDSDIDVIEKYRNDRQEKNYLLVHTRLNINERLPIVFFLRMDSNQEKKYDQYLKAFGEGKRITQI